MLQIAHAEEAACSRHHSLPLFCRSSEARWGTVRQEPGLFRLLWLGVPKRRDDHLHRQGGKGCCDFCSRRHSLPLLLGVMQGAAAQLHVLEGWALPLHPADCTSPPQLLLPATRTHVKHSDVAVIRGCQRSAQPWDCVKLTEGESRRLNPGSRCLRPSSVLRACLIAIRRCITWKTAAATHAGALGQLLPHSCACCCVDAACCCCWANNVDCGPGATSGLT
mgnify:CR=1 FL=1